MIWQEVETVCFFSGQNSQIKENGKIVNVKISREVKSMRILRGLGLLPFSQEDSITYNYHINFSNN